MIKVRGRQGCFYTSLKRQTKLFFKFSVIFWFVCMDVKSSKVLHRSPGLIEKRRLGGIREAVCKFRWCASLHWRCRIMRCVPKNKKHFLPFAFVLVKQCSRIPFRSNIYVACFQWSDMQGYCVHFFTSNLARVSHQSTCTINPRHLCIWRLRCCKNCFIFSTSCGWITTRNVYKHCALFTAYQYMLHYFAFPSRISALTNEQGLF